MLLMKSLIVAALLSIVAGSSMAQQVEKKVGIVAEEVASQMQAFSYREGPKSTLLFRSTALALAAEGDGQVEFQDGRSSVDVSFRQLPDPWTLGPYTTYVLWAVTIDGRATNLGSIEVVSGRGSLNTSTALAPERMDAKKKLPLDLVQARYAMRIADLALAKEFAAASYEKARALLAAAETAQASKKYSERKEAPRLSRETVQAAEDARRESIEAKVAAEEKTRLDAAALAARQAAEEQARLEAEAAREEAARQAAIALDESRRQAELAAREAAAKASADEAAKARADFTARLNRALPTRETDRGIVAEISGVQFAIGAAALNPAAREALARFSGIVVTYPELRFKIEGHTDTTGSDATNRALSLQRAITVRDYLVAQGVVASTVEVEGLGPDRPAADNATAQGRARNRRVEIVLTGGPVGP